MDAYIPLNHTFFNFGKTPIRAEISEKLFICQCQGQFQLDQLQKLRLLFQSPRFKKIGKIRPYLRQLSFRIQAVSYFTQS